MENIAKLVSVVKLSDFVLMFWFCIVALGFGNWNHELVKLKTDMLMCLIVDVDHVSPVLGT